MQEKRQQSTKRRKKFLETLDEADTTWQEDYDLTYLASLLYDINKVSSRSFKRTF